MAAEALPDYLIGPLPGYTPAIGRLVSMLAYGRTTTLEAVEGLTQADLDHLLDDDANSIAMLLEHIPQRRGVLPATTWSACTTYAPAP